MEATQKNNGPVSAQEALAVHPYVIRRCIKETADTFSMELTSHGGYREFRYRPGQFNMLYVFGVGEVPISISGDPADRSLIVHTTRAVGGVTRAMKTLKKEDIIGVRGPYGRGWPIDEAEDRDVVVIAGGIGLAPLRPVIYHLLNNRDRYGRIVLLYGARTPEDILYKKELEKWRSRFDLEILLTVDRATGSWKGNVGVVTQLIARAPFDRSRCMAMICGPEVMMRFTGLELKKHGVADNAMYVSMERNMKCGVGLCGHCQLGPSFVCKDGPVYGYDRIGKVFTRREM